MLYDKEGRETCCEWVVNFFNSNVEIPLLPVIVGHLKGRDGGGQVAFQAILDGRVNFCAWSRPWYDDSRRPLGFVISA